MNDNPELLSFLQSEEQNARDQELDASRAAALELYQGLPFGNEIEGQSQLVTRDVAEVVDADVAAIMRIMVSGDRIVQFEAKSQGEAQAADDASEYIHYQFMRSQDGYTILHDWLKAGELEKTGVVKTWAERRSEPVQIDVPGELLVRDGERLTVDGMEVVSAEQTNPDELIVDGVTGEALPAPEMFRVTARRPLPTKFHDAVVPNEEFLVAADARDLESAVYICHRTPKSLSDLRLMGFKFDDDKLWANANDSRVVSDARDADRSRRDDEYQRRGAMRRVWLSEEYVLYDANDDGVAERLCIHRVGSTILSIEEIDEHPFEEWCPYPMTARRVGQSLTDKTADIQVVRSTLLRQAMNSLYLSTSPRTLIAESSVGPNTIEDLLTVRPGALIRYEGGVAPQPWQTAAVHGDAFSGMEAMSAERESRTGVTRMNQGLDADLFNRTSATGTLALQAAGNTMMEYRARNFVQNVARLFAKKYRLARKYGEPTAIVVDGKERLIDPRQWPEEMDIQVRVGLGTGNKDLRIQRLSSLLETQIEGYTQGLPIVTLQNIYNTSRQLVSDFAIGNPSDYVTQPPEQGQEQQEKPDPAVIQAQTEQMKAQAEEQRKTMKAQADIEADAQTRAIKLQIEQENAAAERQLRRERAEAEAILAKENADRQFALAIERQNRDFALKERSARMDAAVADSGEDDPLPSLHPGGEIDK